MSGFSALGKRLSQLEAAIRFRSPRIVVLTLPVDATGTLSAETEAAVAELHQQLAVTDDDLVVHIANYGAGPEQLPQLVNVTQQG
jgi:hypothetical protein